MTPPVRVVTLEALPVFARSVLHEIRGGDEWGLSGSLGAGKTTLVREIVQAFGGGDVVSSPTFVLGHEYVLPERRLTVEHWDLYRLSALPEELRYPPETSVIRFIEWPERSPELLERVTGIIRLSCVDEDPTLNGRNIEVVRRAVR